MVTSVVRLAMLISGGGTTVEAILRACQKGGQLYGKVEPVLLIASKKGIGGIRKAIFRGLSGDNIVVSPEPEDSADREAWGESLIEIFQRYRVDLIGQYGWHPMTPTNVIEAFSDRMINQHPAPVPYFGGKGMHGIRPHAARLYFVRQTRRNFWTIVVAQKVSSGRYDEGEVYHRNQVPINCDDDPPMLQKRAFPIEHQTQIETLEMFANANGNIKTLPPTPDLVLDDELDILAEAKRAACLLYPKG